MRAATFNASAALRSVRRRDSLKLPEIPPSACTHPRPYVSLHVPLASVGIIGTLTRSCVRNDELLFLTPWSVMITMNSRLTVLNSGDSDVGCMIMSRDV